MAARNLTDERAFIFWMNIYPNDYEIPSDKFKRNLREWYRTYNDGVKLT